MHKMTEINKSRFPGPAPQRSLTSSSDINYYFIPVVVHVIHNGGVENISDAQVISQIERLNMDFGHYGSYNSDTRGVDTRIRFCLASTDPQGNGTTGIEHIQSEYTDLKSDDEMLTKNLSRWDQKRYLNIWVVKSIDGDEQTQGYSYLPRYSQGPIFEGDGIVITYKYFGKITNRPTYYNLGRTTTHEAGHYFNLLHPWGGDNFDGGEGGCNDDDGIDDTPTCSEDYYAISPDCNHPEQCGNTRMIEDFMDYSTDRCMSVYTEGQAEVMRKSILKYRQLMVSYDNIVKTGCLSMYDSLNCDKKVDMYPNPLPINSKSLSFWVPCKEADTLQLFIYDFYGRFVLQKTFDEVKEQEIKLDLWALRPGMYYVIGYYNGTMFQRKLVIGYLF